MNTSFTSLTVRLRPWLLASRPKTLPAAAAPVLVGTALAWQLGGFRPGPALAALAGALLLQIGANLANDVYDYQHGADTADRLGPLRVTQAGLLAPAQVKTGMWLVFGLASLCGLYLVLAAGWPVVVIGLCSILAAIAYTGGPYPLGYHGLGEWFVFIFFGLAGVMGTCYVQALRLSWTAFWAAVCMGLLTAAILVVNNLRDIVTDRAAGKRTLAARFGAAWARREYLALLAAAYLIPPALALAGAASPAVLLSWLSLPMALRLARFVCTQEGRPLNLALARTGQLELLFGVLFALGLLFV